MNMKLKNKKGFTLVELLAVIVVLAIVMGIAAVAITNVLDDTRKNAFVSSAKSYIAGAKTLVNIGQTDVLLGQTNKYVPTCGDTDNSIKISISEIKTEGNSNDKSPYGLPFDRSVDAQGNITGSYVEVTAKAVTAGDAKNCDYEYSIYLTDGVYSIGTTGDPKAETELVSSLVTAK